MSGSSTGSTGWSTLSSTALANLVGMQMKTAIPADLEYQYIANSVSADPLQVRKLPVEVQELTPVPVGSDEHVAQYEQVCQGVAQAIVGEWPSELCERYGLPTHLEMVPQRLRSLIKYTALEEGCSQPMAFARFVRMDDWRQPFDLMLDTVLDAGGCILEPWAYSGNPDGPDLVARTRVHAEAAAYVSEWMALAFDTKTAIKYPRPWQCSNVPKSRFTVFPFGDAGDEHGEYWPGHIVNGAASLNVLERVTDGPAEAYQACEIIAQLVGQGRSFGGLHYWLHVLRVHNYVRSRSELGCPQH